MCEICGGPHFTVKCPQYEGSSAYYYANPYVQPQPYFSQGYSSYQYEEPYHQPQQQNSEVYDQDQLDRILGMLVQLVATDETTQKMIQEHEVMFQNNQSILSDIRCSVEEMSRKLEEVIETENKGIIDFGCEEDEIMMQMANCGIVRESVEEVDEWQVYQKSLVKGVDVDEELDLGDSLGSLFDDEVEVEVEKKVLSWEDEFLGELEDLSDSEQGGEFDPLGDLENLEALLEGKPEKINEPTPHVEIKCGDLPKEVDQVVEEEEHHSWPVVLIINETKKSKPREKARKRKIKNRDWLQVKSWYKEERNEPLKQDHSSHYMPRIRFMPGKFKFWWSDPFLIFKFFYNSTIKFLIVYEERVELNGLDRVQIKEKPPD
ncbi:hypothetical protein HanXRQr2_Chr03g0111821 [Helianthus annuus]|uniref:Uncharacterized protein n=1 Tax=Helianthus annuus TaxID=4232 RepID=A0A9K3JG09_HELAN|nr:uncharacterized protein LOC110929557 [Helianthus annuus]KAF5814503.1 hypothetical protein HanXRQr2_Chr03g0111821 [Helianthus annuus]KAJ0600892.1 hypothetical protein HanIR_Chr03g0122241 [Helianthus annuus]KAJ0943737.1 hypothetical protein HanPSC8_Chr03g0108201 [Helianthus annuus]